MNPASRLERDATVRVRVMVWVRISLRLTLTLTLTLNSDYTTLLISQLYCNICIRDARHVPTRVL